MLVTKCAMKNCLLANVKIVGSRSNPSKARKRKGFALTDAGGTGGTITTRRNNCINKGNVYRLNNLTKPPKRVMYSVTKEEVNDEGKEDNQNRSITQISKET